MPLKNQIISEIERSGDMPLDRYMEICNSHYYATRDPLGAKGDFTTAPEISQIFGEMVGVWLITRWEKLGRPEKCALVELGPGRGTLMADILRIVKKYFLPEVHFVETSSTLRESQKQKVPDAHWYNELPELTIPAIVIANEFFDALPFKQFVAGVERKITRDITFNIQAEDGLTIESCPAGDKIVEQIGKKFAAGIIIDYGYIQSRKSSTLQALKDHKYHNPLETPGDADLTCLVDFAKISGILTGSSGKLPIITTQREFLLAHGADVRAKILGKESDLERLINPQQMGELFKVLCF